MVSLISPHRAKLQYVYRTASCWSDSFSSPPRPLPPHWTGLTARSGSAGKSKRAAAEAREFRAESEVLRGRLAELEGSLRCREDEFKALLTRQRERRERVGGGETFVAAGGCSGEFLAAVVRPAGDTRPLWAGS